jgi:hypothetical protein
MSENSAGRSDLIAHTSDIVVAHISRHSVSTDELPKLIATVYDTLSGLGAPAARLKTELKTGLKPEALDNFLRLKDDLDDTNAGDPKLLRLLRGFREQLEHHKDSESSHQ